MGNFYAVIGAATQNIDIPVEPVFVGGNDSAAVGNAFCHADGVLFVVGGDALSFGLGVGTGYYGGQSALAVGASAMTDGGNWIFKGNFSVNTKGRVGAGAGALFQW